MNQLKKVHIEDKVEEIIKMSENLNEGERKKIALVLLASTLNDLAVENIMEKYLTCEHCGQPKSKCSGYKCWIR
tara:strand:+ start:387 stop:608 length:222 start_codon:yes stop_codon:yes gene_type:complete